MDIEEVNNDTIQDSVINDITLDEKEEIEENDSLKKIDKEKIKNKIIELVNIIFSVPSLVLCLIIVLTIIIYLGLKYDLSTKFNILFLTQWFSSVQDECVTIGACSIASILAFMTILSIGVSNQNDSYFGIRIMDIYKCRNKRISMSFSFEILTLLWLCALVFIELLFNCYLLVICTSILCVLYCITLWINEGCIIVRNDKRIFKIMKNAYYRNEKSLQTKSINPNINKFFIQYIKYHDCKDLIDEKKLDLSIDSIIEFIYMGLRENITDYDYQKQMIAQLRCLLQYLTDNEIDKTTSITFMNNEYIEKIKKM